MIKDLKFAQEIHHFAKFACAAYGWKLIYGYQFKKSVHGLIEGIKLNDAANEKVNISQIVAKCC